ncbi:MAG: alpha-L-fucosidase, partial [Candidatus Hydrogenedentes bacterium]|nr:alpha-L-fucosidase [Candidatus Hydrogenedentota bacterium]
MAVAICVSMAATGRFPAHDCAAATEPALQNKPERLEWLRDAGFGMFVHWSMDSQLGCVISHTMVGASDDYLDRYINELPKTFNPKRFDPDELATMAKLAGMKYIVFTAKHHCGFCMWDTDTTSFKITNTPYGKDLLAEYVSAVRRAGLAVGLYYSPEDFLFLHRHGITIRRRGLKISADIQKKYDDYIRRQCRELMTRYGKIDVLFIDGSPKEPVKETCWSIQPNLLITRGAISTPEQNVPGKPPEGAWESCITMGTQWQYKPTNENYKSATRIIELLIETRAKGGALLLNAGPKPNGELPIEQESRLREIALWNFVNGESMTGVRPWIVTNEKNIWFTRRPDENTVYAIVTKMPKWSRGERKTFVLGSVKATDTTAVSVLGQSSKVVEYRSTDASSRWRQTDRGLEVSVVRAQRLYNDGRWPDPVVIKLENVVPSVHSVPEVQTGKAKVDAGSGEVKLTG